MQDRPLGYLVQQDLAATHTNRVRMIVMAASMLLIVLSVGWGIFFGLRNAWFVAAWELAVSTLGAIAIVLTLHGHLRRAKVLLVFSLLVMFLISTVFLDLPSLAVPRSAHLAFIPLAVASYLIFKGEHPVLQHGVPIFCLAAAAFFGSSDFALETAYAIPEEVRRYGGWVNNVAAFGILYLLIHIFIGDINRMENFLHDANNRFVDMVSHMFPKPIAERLLATGKTFAERYPHCSILFADIVGFTSLSENMEPEATVSLLARVFGRFDEDVENMGLTKIKTIGDAYMVAAGVPEPNADHARLLIEFGQRMFGRIRDIEGIDLRIGIASGELVAGVVGQSRQLFDVWGDVVNTASRMESHGVPGRIQVAESTYLLTREWFAFEALGEISIKGKEGKHKAYLLVSGPVPASEARLLRRHAGYRRESGHRDP